VETLHAWTSYWQSFTVAVHNQPIPNVQKMTYLLSSLKGEPLRDIQGLGVTNENYPVAIRLLVEKYGDDGELEDKIHMEMQHLPAANESLQSLIELSQSFERYCQQLEEMRVPTCNPTITALLKAKIPKGARGRLTEKEAESMNRWDTDDWRKGLKMLIKIHVGAGGLQGERGQEAEVSQAWKIPRPGRIPHLRSHSTASTCKGEI